MGLGRLGARLAAAGLLLLSIVCFALPWMTIQEDTRRAEATGLELVRRDVAISGSYVHASSEGDVEVIVHNSETWARIALVVLAIAVLLLLVPLRLFEWAAAVVTALATVALIAWTQAATADFPPPEGDRHGGFWLSLLFAVFALVPIVLLLRMRPPERGGEWLDSYR